MRRKLQMQGAPEDARAGVLGCVRRARHPRSNAADGFSTHLHVSFFYVKERLEEENYVYGRIERNIRGFVHVYRR